MVGSAGLLMSVAHCLDIFDSGRPAGSLGDEHIKISDVSGLTTICDLCKASAQTQMPAPHGAGGALDVRFG